MNTKQNKTLCARSTEHTVLPTVEHLDKHMDVARIHYLFIGLAIEIDAPHIPVAAYLVYVCCRSLSSSETFVFRFV